MSTPALDLTLETSPIEQCARLEEVARARGLPSVTTWEEWDASFGEVETLDAEELARFEAGLARDKR